MLPIWGLFLCAQSSLVLANTEKAIFLGPISSQVPTQHPTLEDLQLEAISPKNWSLRTHLRAEFPTADAEFGQASWLLLHDLQEGQRYEVRVCWAATQPTSFRLDTYELQTVFETPALITSLAQYSETRQSNRESMDDLVPASGPDTQKTKPLYSGVSSILFLQVLAAADYYTMNKSLMENVPPIYVDIILDPFLLNVLPRSLVPTVAYILVLAIFAWFLSKYISTWLKNVALSDQELVKKNT